MQITLVPKLARPVKTFSAPDPWAGGGPTQFSLDAYLRVPELNQGMPVSAKLPLQKYLLGLRASGGALHLLPEALAFLWREGELSDAALVSGLHALEPSLSAVDHRLALVNGGLIMGFGGFGGAVLGGIGALAWSLVPQEPMLEPLAFVAFGLAVLVPGALWGFVAVRASRRRAQIAAFRTKLGLPARGR